MLNQILFICPGAYKIKWVDITSSESSDSFFKGVDLRLQFSEDININYLKEVKRDTDLLSNFQQKYLENFVDRITLEVKSQEFLRVRLNSFALHLHTFIREKHLEIGIIPFSSNDPLVTGKWDKQHLEAILNNIPQFGIVHPKNNQFLTSKKFLEDYNISKSVEKHITLKEDYNDNTTKKNSGSKLPSCLDLLIKRKVEQNQLKKGLINHIKGCNANQNKVNSMLKMMHCIRDYFMTSRLARESLKIIKTRVNNNLEGLSTVEINEYFNDLVTNYPEFITLKFHSELDQICMVNLSANLNDLEQKVRKGVSQSNK